MLPKYLFLSRNCFEYELTEKSGMRRPAFRPEQFAEYQAGEQWPIQQGLPFRQ